MQSAFIINDRTGKPYAVVGILAGGTEFYPIAESAVSWASWMTADFAAKKISKQELSVTLDNSMSLEGPMPVNRANKAKLDELIKKAKKVKKVESDKEPTEEKVLLPVISLIDARLDNLENEDWRNAVNFKAKSFIADANKSTFAYEVKRTRAVWDPSLAIPGTERRGGFRCPPGTRYGGQITDRFGRNCGWGVARRLANEIADLGARVENLDDRRRGRRVARRNERVARRMAEGGRVERAARAIGNALDSKPTEERGPGLLERVAGRVGNALDSSGTPSRPRRNRRGLGINRREGEGRGEALVRRLEELADGDGGRPAPRRPRPSAPQARPARPRQARRNGEWNNLDILDMDDDQLINAWHDQKPYIPENNRIGMNPMIEEEKRKKRRAIEVEMARRNIPVPAERGNGAGPAPRRPRPNAPAQPRRPRQPRQDNVSKTPVPAGAPRPNESLDDYKRRKYNEHQARVRKIREEGGNAGFLRYDEWEQFHGPAVEDNWNRAQQRNGGRGRRRTATDAGAATAAGRRPSPADQPDAVQPARRQRRPFNAPGQRGLASESAARNKRMRMEREGASGELKIVKHNGKYYVVKKSEVDRANAAGANLEVVNEAPRAPFRPNPAPPAPPAPPTPPAPPRPATPRPQIPVGPNAGPTELRPTPRRGILDRVGRLVNWNGRRGEFAKAHRPSGNMTKAQAVDHVRNGGSLDAVPREHMLAAVVGNLWSPQNPNGKFISVQKNGGNIGDTRMFAVVDSRGNKTGVGFVFKAATEDDNVGEILGFNLAQAHGFDIDGAVRDGSDRGKVFVAIPFNTNNVPADWKLIKSAGGGRGRNFNYQELDALPDKGAPQRVAHFLHNYLLGVADRHGGNGMAQVYEKPDGTRVAHIVPIDQGWAARVGAIDFLEYGRNSLYTGNMDPNFMTKIKTHIAGLRGPEKDKQRQAIIKAVDDMIENSRALAAKSDAEWLDMVKDMYPGVQNNAKAEAIIKGYRKKAKHMQDNRDELLRLLGVD